MNQRKGSTEVEGMVDTEAGGSWGAAVKNFSCFYPFLVTSPGTDFQAGWCGRPPLLQEKSN